MKTEIYNKNGFLSAYGLACGYIEQTELYTEYGFSKKVELYKDLNTYTVRYIDRMKKTSNENYIQIWENFETLYKAKKRYFELIKKVKNNLI